VFSTGRSRKKKDGRARLVCPPGRYEHPEIVDSFLLLRESLDKVAKERDYKNVRNSFITQTSGLTWHFHHL
jgi:hypothetical protein